MPFAATWMDLEITVLSEVSQKEKDKYSMISLTYGIQNATQMNLSMKQRQTHTCREQICGCQGGGEVGEGKIGSLGLADENYSTQVDKQQGPAVWHKELYSIPCNKP